MLDKLIFIKWTLRKVLILDIYCNFQHNFPLTGLGLQTYPKFKWGRLVATN